MFANIPSTIRPRSRTFESEGPNSSISFFFKFPKSFFGFNFGFSTSSSSKSSLVLYRFTGYENVEKYFNSSHDIPDKKTGWIRLHCCISNGLFYIRYEELKMILDIDLWCAKDIFSISPISIRNGHMNSWTTVTECSLVKKSYL